MQINKIQSQTHTQKERERAITYQGNHSTGKKNTASIQKVNVLLNAFQLEIELNTVPHGKHNWH